MKAIVGFVGIIGFLLLGQMKCLGQTVDASVANLFAEGYGLNDLEKVMNKISYKNYSKWMKKQGYTYMEAMNNGYTQVFEKNDVLTMGLFFSPDDKELKHAMMFSSPQKFYQAMAELETGGFKKMSTERMKNDSGGAEFKKITWKKSGYPFVFETNDQESYIKIMR